MVTPTTAKVAKSLSSPRISLLFIEKSIASVASSTTSLTGACFTIVDFS